MAGGGRGAVWPHSWVLRRLRFHSDVLKRSFGGSQMSRKKPDYVISPYDEEPQRGRREEWEEQRGRWKRGWQRDATTSSPGARHGSEGATWDTAGTQEATCRRIRSNGAMPATPGHSSQASWSPRHLRAKYPYMPCRNPAHRIVSITKWLLLYVTTLWGGLLCRSRKPEQPSGHSCNVSITSAFSY